MAEKRAKPQPAPEPRQHSLVTFQAFLDQARSLADWHRRRSENFESKAGTILGISGVLLALTSLAVDPISDVRGGWQVAAAVLTGLGGLSFLASALFAIHTLTLREHRFSSVSQLRREWEKYRDTAAQTEQEVTGMIVDSLISADEGNQSAIESLVCDANDRGTNVGRSIRLLLVGFLLVTAAGGILFVEVLMR